MITSLNEAPGNDMNHELINQASEVHKARKADIRELVKVVGVTHPSISDMRVRITNLKAAVDAYVINVNNAAAFGGEIGAEFMSYAAEWEQKIQAMIEA